ncbi:MAG: hypothetical protein ACRYFX_10255 [Janthinobacterium lividum]
MHFLASLLLAATVLTTASGQHHPARRATPAASGITKIAYETASGGRLGGYSSLVITPDSTVYIEGTRSSRKAFRAKTAPSAWASLAKSFNLSSFRQLKSTPGHQAYDGTDVTLSITQGQETVSRVNGEDDALHYKALQPFTQQLDAQLAHCREQVAK